VVLRVVEVLVLHFGTGRYAVPGITPSRTVNLGTVKSRPPAHSRLLPIWSAWSGENDGNCFPSLLLPIVLTSWQLRAEMYQVVWTTLEYSSSTDLYATVYASPMQHDPRRIMYNHVIHNIHSTGGYNRCGDAGLDWSLPRPAPRKTTRAPGGLVKRGLGESAEFGCPPCLGRVPQLRAPG
jgi:hypothetical protein